MIFDQLYDINIWHIIVYIFKYILKRQLYLPFKKNAHACAGNNLRTRISLFDEVIVAWKNACNTL